MPKKELTASVYIQGYHSFQKVLDSLPKRVGNRVVDRAVRIASRVMLKATKAAAPVKSGLLKKSLNVRKLKKKRGRFAWQVGFKNVDQIVLASSSSNPDNTTRYFYPASVEYGHGNVPEHPYLRPAFEANKATAAKVMTDEIRTGLIKAAKDAGGEK